MLASFASAGETPWAAERSHTWTSNDTRIYVNSPGDFDARRPTQLVIFALPNGNTIEQTLGCGLAEKQDWHFQIQHIAAQIRKLRSLSDENIILACVEAKGLSWPTWRKARPDNAVMIRKLVDEIVHHCPTDPRAIALTGHSGGGSFITGYINGGESIPAAVNRIAYLDANYSYSDEQKHGDKLLAWLKESKSRHLVVIAYDDRGVMLNGKPIVSDTGGTYGSSHRMIDRFSRDFKLEDRSDGTFERFVGMDGQIRFYIHRNPEEKILHTVLVERNGLLEALTAGTKLESKAGQFWGERAYTDFIQPAATTRPAASSSLLQSLNSMSKAERENAIEKAILSGEMPPFLKNFVPIRVTAADTQGVKHEAVYRVTPDYVGVGSNEAFCRMPLTPMAATRIAKAMNCSLTTRKMSDDIYRAADVKLEPRPLTERRDDLLTFIQHNNIIESQRVGQPPGRLVAGIKKDVVLTNKLKDKPNKVAIYGWHKLDGKAIQPLYTGHVDWYVDYSHGIRLVAEEMTVDGKPARFSDVLKDPSLCVLLSDEGPIDAAYGTHDPAK